MGRERRSARLCIPCNKLPAVHRRSVSDDTIRDTSTAVSFVTLYREYERGAREGGIRYARRPRETIFNGENYQIAPLPGLSIFMNSDERLHGITISPPPGRCRRLNPSARPTPGRLLWIVSRESNDRDEADEMECGLHVQLPKSTRRPVSPRTFVLVEILAGVHSRRDSAKCCRSNGDNKPLSSMAVVFVAHGTHVVKAQILNIPLAAGSVCLIKDSNGLTSRISEPGINRIKKIACATSSINLQVTLLTLCSSTN